MKDDRIYIDHMLQSIDRIKSYLEDLQEAINKCHPLG